MKAIVNINLRRDILFFYATRFQIELSGLFGLILKRLNQRADSCLNFMINAPFQLCITRVGKLRLAGDQKPILPCRSYCANVSTCASRPITGISESPEATAGRVLSAVTKRTRQTAAAQAA